jgi:PleD family two-component response regulator
LKKFAIRFAVFPIFSGALRALFGFAQISQLAATVEEASEKELYQQLQALIALITETVAGHDKNNRRILVVDDDPNIQHFLKLSLEEEGYVVTHCSTIAQAWKIMNEENVELVILDLILPDGDGRNLLLDLRISNRFANTPIVVLSSQRPLCQQ